MSHFAITSTISIVTVLTQLLTQSLTQLRTFLKCKTLRKEVDARHGSCTEFERRPPAFYSANPTLKIRQKESCFIYFIDCFQRAFRKASAHESIRARIPSVRIIARVFLFGISERAKYAGRNDLDDLDDLDHAVPEKRVRRVCIFGHNTGCIRRERVA